MSSHAIISRAALTILGLDFTHILHQILSLKCPSAAHHAETYRILNSKTLERQIYGLPQPRYTRVERNTHGEFMRSPPVLPAVACPRRYGSPERNTMSPHDVTRRAALGFVGAGSVIALAGCAVSVRPVDAAASGSSSSSSSASSSSSSSSASASPSESIKDYGWRV